jgi:hypothetical protein
VTGRFFCEDMTTVLSGGNPPDTTSHPNTPEVSNDTLLVTGRGRSEWPSQRPIDKVAEHTQVSEDQAAALTEYGVVNGERECELPFVVVLEAGSWVRIIPGRGSERLQSVTDPSFEVPGRG